MPDYCQVIKAAQNSCGRVIKVSTRHPSDPNLIKRSLDSLEMLPSHRPIFYIWLGWLGASSVSPAAENDMQQRKSNTHNDFCCCRSSGWQDGPVLPRLLRLRCGRCIGWHFPHRVFSPAGSEVITCSRTGGVPGEDWGRCGSWLPVQERPHRGRQREGLPSRCRVFHQYLNMSPLRVHLSHTAPLVWTYLMK